MTHVLYIGFHDFEQLKDGEISFVGPNKEELENKAKEWLVNCISFYLSCQVDKTEDELIEMFKKFTFDDVLIFVSVNSNIHLNIFQYYHE